MIDSIPFPPQTILEWILCIIMAPFVVSALLGAGLLVQYCRMRRKEDKNAPPQKLETQVPEDRPMRPAETLHGTVELYDFLSDEAREAGARLRDSRFCANLSLGDAAAKLGVTVVELSECERGVRLFRLPEALTILGIPERKCDRSSFLPFPTEEELTREDG